MHTMKNRFLFGMLICLGSVFALSCGNNCDPNPTGTCAETPPTNEMCTAYFTRWFYNAQTQTCTQIGYSGCSQRGFATEQECEACKCQEWFFWRCPRLRSGTSGVSGTWNHIHTTSLAGPKTENKWRSVRPLERIGKSPEKSRYSTQFGHNPAKR